MCNMYTYLKYYKELSFAEIPFNDVDNLVFSTLAYLPLKGLVSKEDVPLNLLKQQLKIVESHHQSLKTKALNILNEIAGSKRYQKVTIGNYIDIHNAETQFKAITIRFNQSNCYVTYQGTDNSLVGWKEDFDLAYCYPVPAQRHAAIYLNNAVKDSDKIVYVGGHSKGGNLAMAAAMEANNSISHKIMAVYNNDGPGFLNAEYHSPKFQNMARKLKVIIPEESFVGVLLSCTNKYQVVKSSAENIYQHDLTTWQCFGLFLLEGSQSKTSQKFQHKINTWINQTDKDNKELLINSLFKVIEESQIQNFHEFRHLTWAQLSTMIKEAKHLNEKSKQLLLENLINLINHKGKE